MSTRRSHAHDAEVTRARLRSVTAPGGRAPARLQGAVAPVPAVPAPASVGERSGRPDERVVGRADAADVGLWGDRAEAQDAALLRDLVGTVPSADDDAERFDARAEHVRWSVSARAAGGVVVVLLGVVGWLGVRAWTSGPGPVVPLPATASGTPAAASGVAPAPSGATAPLGEPAGASASAAPVYVHVVGQVAEPGVVELPVGARVSDAIDLAGGPTARADLAAVNLARAVVDGEQIRVPEPGEVPAPSGTPGTSGPEGGTASPGSGGQIDLNAADAAELDQIPGIGPVLAQRILEHRELHGPFRSVEALEDVSGIGPAMLGRIAPHVRVG